MKYCRSIILTIFTLLIGFTANSQYSSTLGRFEVDQISGCAPFDITITNLLGASCPCDVRFGDGAAGQGVYTHTYNTAGTYLIEIDYQSMIPRTDQLTITVVENLPPQFDIQLCSSNEATINITDLNYDEYVVDFLNDGSIESVISQGGSVPPYTFGGPGTYDISVRGRNNASADNCNANVTSFSTINVLTPSNLSQVTVLDQQTIDLNYTPVLNTALELEVSNNGTGAFQYVQDLDQSGAVQLSSATYNTDNSYYCFRIASFDPCNNSRTYSNVLCSVKFDLSIQDGRNVLTWQNGGPVVDYTICKDGDCSISTTQKSYTDTDISCNIDYCYQIIANYPNSNNSVSIDRCGTSFSNTPATAISNIVTQIDGKSIQIKWTPPPGNVIDSYDIKRSTSGSFITEKFSTPLNSYSDSWSLNKSHCYSIGFQEECTQSVAFSSVVCPIIVSTKILSDNSIRLNWNSYDGYSNGISTYRIEKFDLNGNLITTYLSNSTTYTDTSENGEQKFYYRIYAIPNEAGVEASYSNLVAGIKNATVSRPQAFTPDGDGLNDEFLVYTTFIQQFRLTIYNRWGQLIFNSSDKSVGWDGTYNGNLLPTGSYAYNIELTDLANRSWEVSGFIALIRK